MTSHVCTICARNMDHQAMACQSCRDRADNTLIEIGHHHVDLPDHLERGVAGGQRTSGSREAPLPLRVDPLDLSMPAQRKPVHVEMVDAYTVETATVTHRYFNKTLDVVEEEVPVRNRRQLLDNDGKPVKVPADDQIGYVSVLTQLSWWVDDWIAVADKRERPPKRGGPSMITWLRNRLDWAAQEHPAVHDFAEEMQDLRTALRRTLGLTGKPEFLDVPCRRCDWLSLLHVPRQDRVECVHCGDLSTGDEFHRWSGLLATGVWNGVVDIDLNRLLYTDEAALLVRVKEHSIRQWASRGILPIAEREYGRPRFTIGAVFEAERSTRSGIPTEQIGATA